MGSKTWKLRKGLGWIIKHTFLGASIASDHMVTLVDLEKVLKETDAPYAPMTPEITKKAYEYMVKGKIGRLGPKYLKPQGIDIWGGLKKNLETLLQAYETGKINSNFNNVEYEARRYLHATLAVLVASTDDESWAFFEEHKEKMSPGKLLHELMKREDACKDLTWYLDPGTKEKVEKTPYSWKWEDAESAIRAVNHYEIYKEVGMLHKWYEVLRKYAKKAIPIPR